MNQMETNEKTALIIGGGVGGLFTGAILAKEGYRVTVLDKNRNIGGGLQTFVRNGEEFETGMHILGGFQPGGNLNKICSYLGILDRLNIEHDSGRCIDRITYLSDGNVVEIPRGREAFVEYFSQRYPDHAAEIRAYVDEIYRLSEEVDVFYLREEDDFFKNRSENFFRPVDEVIDSLITSPQLRDIMAFINPMYGGVKGVTPAYIHAIISVLYIEGQSKFKGGSRQLTEALVSVIEGASGQVIGGKKVCALEMDDKRHVGAVRCTDGSVYTAQVYISSIHPVRMLDLVPPGTFKKAYSERLRSIPNSYSAFQAFFVMKPGTFPYLEGVSFLVNDYKDTWHLADDEGEDWPRGLLYFTPRDKGEATSFSRKVVVNCVQPFSAVEQWADSRLGHRPPEYTKWKEECLGRIVRRMEQLYPQFGQSIEHVYTSSPLTVRDHYDVPDGSLYGFTKNASNIALSQLTVYTKVPNLLLTGQCVNLHGICGVPLTAIMTAEALVGRNAIIRKINEEYNSKNH